MNRRNFVAGSTALAAVALLPQEQVKAEFTVKYTDKNGTPVNKPNDFIRYGYLDDLKKGDMINIEWNGSPFHAIITDVGDDFIQYEPVDYLTPW